MTDSDLEASAADFWADTGLADSYPRNVEQAIALKLPVTVVKLPAVTVQAVGHWLTRHHRAQRFPNCRSDMSGCLYADGGHGFLFVCGADEPEEQRFTLAHEAAHFLVDYLGPRTVVARELGQSALEVIDGRRPATVSERASAVLARVRLGPHWHLLPRVGEGVRLACVEDRADDLGLELAAPRREVLRALGASPSRDACAHLGKVFGLPAYVFEPLVAARLRERSPSFLRDALRILGRGS